MDMNRIIVNLLLRQPFYGYILSSLNLVGSGSVDEIRVNIGATVQMIYNPEWLDSLEESEAYGRVLHEILHLILMHSFRRGTRDPLVWAMAGDLAVNEHISKGMHWEDVLTVEKANRILAVGMEPFKTADYYYDQLLEAAPPSTLPFSIHRNRMLLHFPDEKELGVNIESQEDLSELNMKAAQSKLEEITRQAVAEGEVTPRLMGQMGGIYASARVNWRNILKQFMTGKGRTQSHKTVKRVSKRFDDMPGNKRHKGLEALVAIDESGSINDEDVLNFYKELRGLKRVVKADLMVTRFDTDCTRPVLLERYLRSADRAKNGGTDFRSVFNLADSLNARIVLIFTDGEGIMPESVRQNALWLLTKKTDIPPNLGTTVSYTG